MSFYIGTPPAGEMPTSALGQAPGLDLTSFESTINADATVDIGSSPNRRILINGGAAITSFGTQPNRERILRFNYSGATLTHNATSLILPTGANIVTINGDTCMAVSDAGGNWRVIAYQRADGTALVAAATGAVRYDGAQTLNGTQRAQAKSNIGALGNGYQYVNTSGTLSPSAAGNMLLLQSGITVTLPPMANMQAYDMIVFRGWNGSATVAAASGESLTYNNGTVSSLKVRQSQDMIVQYNGSQWIVFGYATAQGDAPSYNEDQRSTTSLAQKRQARINQRIRGSGLNGITSATTLTADYWGTSQYIFNGGFTITMPSANTGGNGDSMEFTNISGSATTFSVASGDTNCNFFFGKGTVQKTFILQPGSSCVVVADGNNFIVFNNFAAEAGAPNADFSQTFSKVQRQQLRKNLRVDGADVVGVINTNTTFDASFIGVLIVLQQTQANVVHTLPPVSTMAPGDSFKFMNQSDYAVNIQVDQGTDKGNNVNIQVAQNGTQSFYLQGRTTVVIRTNGASWYVEGQSNLYNSIRQGVGAGQNANIVSLGWSSGAFLKAAVDSTDLGRVWTDYNTAQSLQGTGYQKLPNGLILNWVRVSTTSDLGINWAIAFPNTIMSYGVGLEIGDTNQGALYGGWISRMSNSNFDWRGRVTYQNSTYQPSGNYATLNVFAVGY